MCRVSVIYEWWMRNVCHACYAQFLLMLFYTMKENMKLFASQISININLSDQQ